MCNLIYQLANMTRPSICVVVAALGQVFRSVAGLGILQRTGLFALQVATAILLSLPTMQVNQCMVEFRLE